MMPLFIHYPKCTTCQKAAAWLKANGIEVEARDIVLANPTKPELSAWVTKSQREVSKFFNTSGLRYRALNLKDKVRSAPEGELLDILASDGMLVKRPVLVTSDKVLVGFKEAEWAAALLP